MVGAVGAEGARRGVAGVLFPLVLGHLLGHPLQVLLVPLA